MCSDSICIAMMSYTTELRCIDQLTCKSRECYDQVFLLNFDVASMQKLLIQSDSTARTAWLHSTHLILMGTFHEVMPETEAAEKVMV